MFLGGRIMKDKFVNIVIDKNANNENSDEENNENIAQN